MAPRRAFRRLAVVVVAVALALGVAGCGSDPTARRDGRLAVEASFYPLYWMAAQVGGDLVSVSDLTPAGVEAHDLELTPRDLASLGDADVVVYLSGFQPAIDAGLEGTEASAFDVADAAQLDLHLASDSGGGDAKVVDPHFWLDPTRLASVADAFASFLAEEDPPHAAQYRANAKRVVDRLHDLDREFDGALTTCTSRQLVTTHEAFGYLAQRYDLEQVGIGGLSPDEASAADLAEVSDLVRRLDVGTIYFETLASPDVAETIAAETGAETAVLDPIEGLSKATSGRDYVEIMRSNLGTLREGQGCP